MPFVTRYLAYPLALDLNELPNLRSQKWFLELSCPLINKVYWKGRYVFVQDVGFCSVMDVHLGNGSSWKGFPDGILWCFDGFFAPTPPQSRVSFRQQLADQHVGEKTSPEAWPSSRRNPGAVAREEICR